MSDLKRRSILIIAEGSEEKSYIDKILSFPNVRKDVYEFNPVVNAKGCAKLFARYQYEYQRNAYDLILIFCDADKGRESFSALLEKMGSFFERPEDVTRVIIFSNPVTLQIVLSHFGDVNLTKIGKKSNADLIEKLTGIKGYSAKDEQIKSMVDKIHYNSLETFKERLAKLSTNFKDVPSTNFLEFLRKLEQDDTSWIDEINGLFI